MKQKLESTLVGVAGEYLVAGELALRGYIALAVAGVPAEPLVGTVRNRPQYLYSHVKQSESK